MDLTNLSAGELALLAAIATIAASSVSASAALAIALVNGWMAKRQVIEREIREHRRAILGPHREALERALKERVDATVSGDPDALSAVSVQLQKPLLSVDPLTFAMDRRLAWAFSNVTFWKHQARLALNRPGPGMKLTRLQKRRIVSDVALAQWELLLEMERYMFQRPAFWIITKWTRRLGRWRNFRTFQRLTRPLPIEAADKLDSEQDDFPLH